MPETRQHFFIFLRFFFPPVGMRRDGDLDHDLAQASAFGSQGALDTARRAKPDENWKARGPSPAFAVLHGERKARANPAAIAAALQNGYRMNFLEVQVTLAADKDAGHVSRCDADRCGNQHKTPI